MRIFKESKGHHWQWELLSNGVVMFRGVGGNYLKSSDYPTEDDLMQAVSRKALIECEAVPDPPADNKRSKPTASTKGQCYKCGKAIDVGEEIKWARTGDNAGKWYHPDCSKAVEPSPLDYKEISAKIQSGEMVLDELDNTPVTNDPHEAINETNKRITQIENSVGEAQTDISKEIKKLQRQVKQLLGNGTQTTANVNHCQFDTLMEMVKLGDIYLYGPPGVGKTHSTMEVAKVVRQPYASLSLTPTTPDWRLVGYIFGENYVETDFYKLYKDGGVFCIDEVDNASGSLLSSLDSALSNDLFGFPIGMVERHKDFRMIVTGNTNGMGGDVRYPDRQVLDGAFRDRFMFLDWKIDNELETRLVENINGDRGMPWLAWVRAVRSYCGASFPQLVVSPRASMKGAKLLHTEIPIELVADAALYKGLDKDTVQAITEACPFPKELHD